jgi:hypothetical protein
MLSAYAQSKTCITSEIVEEVMADMLNFQGSTSSAPPKKASPSGPAFQTVPAESAPSPSRPPRVPHGQPASPSARMPQATTSHPSGHPQLHRAPEQSEHQVAAPPATERLSALVKRAETLIRRFDEICSILPKDIRRLEQTHNQVAQTCDEASEQNATLARQGEHTGELVRVIRQLLGRVDGRLNELRQTVSEAAPLCQELPDETDRLADMMRANRSALENAPALSKDMKQLLDAGKNQAGHLQTIIAEAQHVQEQRTPPTGPARLVDRIDDTKSRDASPAPLPQAAE